MPMFPVFARLIMALIEMLHICNNDTQQTCNHADLQETDDLDPVGSHLNH